MKDQAVSFLTTPTNARFAICKEKVMKKIALKTTYYVEMPNLKVLQAKLVIAFDSESKVHLQEAVDLSNAIIKAARKKSFEIEANSMSIVSDGVIYQL